MSFQLKNVSQKVTKAITLSPKMLPPSPSDMSKLPNFDKEALLIINKLYPVIDASNRFIIEQLHFIASDPKALMTLLAYGEDVEIHLPFYEQERAINAQRLVELAYVKGSTKGTKCKKCGSTNTSTFSKQKRSLDEPETVIFTCHNCGS